MIFTYNFVIFNNRERIKKCHIKICFEDAPPRDDGAVESKVLVPFSKNLCVFSALV